jgi:Uma2 family endonuclease
MSTVIDTKAEAELPDRYEVINGQIVEISPMSAFSSEVANRLHARLIAHVERQNIGRSRMDMVFRVPLPEDPTRNRRPDVSYISFQRWPENRPLQYRGNPIDVVPNLIVEVASPTDDAEDLIAKAHEYLRAGAELVWVVYPRVRQLYAYISVSTPPRIFTETDNLDAGSVLPGFSTPMAPLFPIAEGIPEIESDE